MTFFLNLDNNLQCVNSFYWIKLTVKGGELQEMSVKDPYKAKRKEAKPEERRESIPEDNDLGPHPNDIPRTKKVRVDKA